MQNKCYITTPIYYPNAEPHLGSAYTTIVADFLARFYRDVGYKTFFLTGLDEHGEKIEKTAKDKGIEPKAFVDEMAALFKKAWERLGIEYDYFIRTTDEKHKKGVQAFLEKVMENGDIYLGTYEGYYCVGCERYYTEKELLEGLLCPLHLKKVEEKRIESYFFRLSKYKEMLLDFYDKNKNFIPDYYIDQIKNNLKELKDLSISRPKSQVSWGIELPFDKEHVAYVWFDALLNYYTACPKDMWPPDMQIIGKDILWFHAVIWPAMLMAVKEKLPSRILAHGFLTVDGRKMSKSLGNVINPIEMAEKYGNDALRYYLITKIAFGVDGDFSINAFKYAYNNELIGHYGNLANRLAAISNSTDYEKALYHDNEKIKEAIEVLHNSARLYNAESIIKCYTDKIWPIISDINAFLNKEEPWKKKNNSKNVIGQCLNAFFNVSVLLRPLLPNATSNILNNNIKIRDIREDISMQWNPVKKQYVVYKKVD
ncbi:MAG: methionine--tRNA ligase [Candidatus Anstonellales archaeon]